MNLPTSLLAAALVGLALGAGGASKVVANHYRAKAAAQQQEAAEAYQARTVELNGIAAKLEQARHERKTVYRTITRDVEKVVARDLYRHDCLDDSGLSIANAALAGVRTGEPDAAMPAAPAAGR